MSTFSWKLLCFAILASLAVQHCKATDVIVSNWRRLGEYNVTESPLVVGVRTKLECMTECMKHSQCGHVAYQSTSRLCYLLPDQPHIQTPGSDVIMYETPDAVCNAQNVPLNNATVTWHQHTLTSSEGHVTCDAQFLWTTNDSSVTCEADRLWPWRIQGQCAQFEWTTPEEMSGLQVVKPPLPVEEGWRLCLTGEKAPGAEDVVMNFFDEDGDRPMKMAFFFTANGTPVYQTKFSTVLDGNFTNQVTPNQAFPLNENMPFYLEITATSSDTFTVWVDEEFFYSYTTILPTTSVGLVRLTNINLIYLNAWCHAAKRRRK